MPKYQLKQAGIWIASIIVISGIVYGFSILASKAAQKKMLGTPLSVPVETNEWIKGNSQAPITLVEYSDYQCATCITFVPIIKELLREYDSQLRVVYRHFPLLTHPSSFKAAQAAEAAGKQGKFWEMSDKLYTTANEWRDSEDPTENFRKYAQDLSLDLEQFSNDYQSEETKQAVQADIDSGTKSQLQGTPTFFLNGYSINLPRSYQQFEQLIEKSRPQEETTPTPNLNTGEEEANTNNQTPQPPGEQDER